MALHFQQLLLNPFKNATANSLGYTNHPTPEFTITTNGDSKLEARVGDGAWVPVDVAEK